MYLTGTCVDCWQVGCGAIGCEMLKNYALLGVGTSQTGQVKRRNRLCVNVCVCVMHVCVLHVYVLHVCVCACMCVCAVCVCVCVHLCIVK